VSKRRLGTDGEWPRIPKFLDSPPRPAGIPSGDHIVLDDDDERILDKVWAEIRGQGTAIFARTLPPATDAREPRSDADD
jgi:hypothetical protein